MSVPMSTTTIAVEVTTEAEPGEGRTTTVVATGVRAVIAAPSGRERPAPGGGTSRITHVLEADPVPELVDHTCIVVDENDGRRFEVEWVTHRVGLGLDHTKAGLVEKVGRP